jgi:hypothetical protein
VPNPPAKAWHWYRPFADPDCGSDSGLRIDRGAGFDSDAGLDSIDVLLESKSCRKRSLVGNERVRAGGALVDLPFCGKSSVPNRKSFTFLRRS